MPDRISGAAYAMVAVTFPAEVTLLLSSSARVRPKSPNMIRRSPADRRMLAGLTSRCTSPRA
ncbi:Uncharacterised protein [Mycobacteroides abscessus subsp. abscessus]|nr:Uncharacterised protein [Mycobacteroides abscessus subsp. abscessus]